MADDYLFKGIEAPSDSPADSFVDTVAAAGGLVGAAFVFSRTKRGARVLSKLDPIIGQVERRLSKITDDGANAITLSELEGYANQALRGNFPKPSSTVTADEQTDILRDTFNRTLNLQADAEKHLQGLYHSQVIDSIATDFKDAGVNQATIDNMVDAINNIVPSQRYDGTVGFSERLKNTLRDVVMDGDSEHAIFDDTDVALQAIQNLTRKQSFEDWQSVGGRGEKITENFIDNQIRDIGELLEKHQAKKTGEIHDFALADFVKQKQADAAIDNGALDVPIISRNGKRDIIDVDNALDKIRSDSRTAFLADLFENAKYNDSTKYVDGEVSNTPNLDKIKSEARGIVGDTLFGKLFGLDDLSPRNQLGVDVYSNVQFKLGMANFQKEGTLLVRNRDKLYRQDLTTGKMEQMDISGYNWHSANDDIVHHSRIMSQYGVQQEKTNWAQLGRSEGAKRLTDVDGDNLYALRNTNIYQLSESELSALGRRAYSHARAVQSIDIDLEKNTEKIVLDLAASKEGIKKDTLSKIRDVYHAKSESAKRRILRNIYVDQVDNLDLLSVVKAASDGKKINARLRDDGIGIGSEALYKIKSVEETINEAVVKNAVDSLGKTQAEAYAKIDSLNISPGEKQKLKDMYTLEKYKKESGINVIKDRHNFNRYKQDIGSAVFKKIQDTLDDSPEADRILGHYLGNSKDIHYDYGKKGNAAAPVLARKSLDVKKIITSWNSGDLNGLMQGISDSAKGLFANSKLSQTTWLGKITGGHLDFSNNSTANDLSVAGSTLYKMVSRLSGGLNMLDPGAFTGVVNNWLTRGIAQFINIGHGLGLHENATRSSLEIIDKLLFKRVLPASFLYTQLDWADDTFNLNENFQTGLANIDLGFRKFTDATGLTDAFKLAKMANPMAQYISGDYRPYQSYEERLDYYQNGKDPIRAGRYWVWGSSNEFRGSSISYWEDNSLKLAKSDYKTEGIYGGYFNKWMHSPIPTLSNPLSPLIYALNPYWLEEMHSEDRPYLESGPLFESNTLQGLILNPTLGEIIKPKKKYHEDRMWFGRDVKAVMYHMNQQIQEQSQDTRYLIFQNGRLGVYDFTAFDHTTDNEYVQSSDQQYSQQAPMYASAADYVKYINPDGTVNPEVASLQPVTSGTGSAISAMNNAIYSGSSPYTNPNGMYIQQRVRRGRSKGSLEEILNNADLYNNLMNSNGGRDYLDELQTTSRLLTGIYGYIGSSVFGRDESKFIANAGDIDSFTRQFWDAGVGGLGGETAEIGRRFLPEFSRRRRVNPLMNTMADQHAWLPEKFYMGDAYCISKNTMVEVGNLDYLAADEVIENKSVITDHTGQNTIVNKIVCRKIELKEKVYSIKVNSLFAFNYEFSENHPLLITESTNNTTKELSDYSLSYYNKANIILNALKRGINSKKILADIVNISINDVCQLWKRMAQDDLIFDYKLDKYNIYLKNYKLYDINLLKNRLSWKKAKDVKVGNYVAYPIPESKDEEIVIDLGLLIPEYISTEKYIYTSKVRNKQFIEIYEYLENNGVPTFKRGERKLLLEKMGWNDKVYENVQAKFRNKKILKRIPRKFVLTKQICYAFGLYLAEGWNNGCWVGMAHNVNERDYAYNAFLGFKQIDPYISFSFKRTDKTNGAYSGFGSSVIAELLNKLFNKGAYNKKMPEFFWNAKEECVLGLLEGYICGDGCNLITKSGYGSEIEKISVSSCNKKLLYQVRKLLLRFNIVGSINIHNKEPKKNKINKYIVTSGIAYTLSIRGKKASILSELLFGKSLLPINNKAKESSHYYINNGYLYLRIEDIKEIDTVKEVYGYQVNQNNSFCVVGFATHNTKVINGEARLPGAGYEAINQLHPDQFASDGYGAIDRYKILADIAPNSPEYKYWKQIVKMMNSDEAKKVLQDTEEMVKHQGKKHDFFNYKFLGKTTVSQDGHIEEVLSNGKFKIAGDDRLYQIAGVKFKENGFMSKQQLLQVIQPGQRVTMRIDDEERTDNPDAPQAPIRAALFLNGENISDTLREVGLAEYDMDDSSAAGAYANYNTFGRIFGSAAELVTHAQIPILHSQFMRINDPLEEYRSDQLYGSGFASWEDIVDTMLVPTFEQSKTSFVKDLVADSAYRYYKGINSRALDNVSKSRLAVAKFASTYLDGPALAGEITGRFTFVGANAVERKEKLSRAFRFAGNAFAMTTSTDDPMYATYAWGRMGYDIGSHLNLFDKFISDESSIGRFAEHLFGSVDNKGIESLVDFAKRTRASRMLQAAAFAGTGLAIALAKNNPITEALGIDHVYTPDNVEKRWDTEEYFDRLRYIKYMGLYEAAKEKAKAEEGVDVDKLYQHQEALRAEMDGDVSITDMMASVLTSGTPSNDPLAQWINKKFGRLSEDMTTLVAGEWTEQAIMYHQVAESTVYALNKDSEYSDIIRALPSTEKEYFVEFAKVTNEKQRRAILRNVSPSLAKALRLVWYQEETETESNESYFTTHNLPGPLWQGWEASSNLEDIKAKVIYNEGMQFADFGIYSSTYEDPEVINAPNIENIRNGDDPITVRAKINTVLSGIGLTEKQIQVNPTQQDSIIDIVTNVTSVLGYKIDKALSFL